MLKSLNIKVSITLTSFTMRLVNFTKYPINGHLVAVILCFQLTGNKISFICFKATLFIKAISNMVLHFFELSNLFFTVVMPKQLEVFGQNTLLVLLSVGGKNQLDP